VYGADGMLEWHQERPSELSVALRDQPVQVMTRGKKYLSEITRKNERLPPGHPEGYIEAFANIYGNVARVIQAKLCNKEPHVLDLDFPTAADACYWSDFEAKALLSSNNKVWVKISYKLPEV